MQARRWYWLTFLCSCGAPDSPAEHAVTPVQPSSRPLPASLNSQAASPSPATNAEPPAPPAVPAAEEHLERGVRYITASGVAKDYAEAAHWIGKAAAQGHPKAEYLMGVMTLGGEGVVKDEAAAASWFTKAAEHGHVEAYQRLGLIYDLGRGVAEDDAKAAKWYRAAVEHQVPAAMNGLGWLYFAGEGVPKDETEAVRLFQAASDLGDSYATGGLALAYDYGFGGIAANAERALELYDKSGTKWSKDQRSRLAKRAPCERRAVTPLFDAKLLCADRDFLRHKVAVSGARIVRENRADWGDTYDTSAVLSGSTQLYIGYTHDDWFAAAEYEFPGEVLDDVLLRTLTKYGRPRTSSGNTRLGPFSVAWRTKDGIEIELRRDWPPRTTFVAYKHPANFRRMKDEQKAQEYRQKDERYRSETKAF